MKLTSMELSKAESEKAVSPVAADKPEGPRYPWGLSVNLENDSMKKLGLKASDLPVGAEVTLIAKAKVMRAGTFETEGGDARHDAGLQLTQMAIDLGGAKPAADVLFKGKD